MMTAISISSATRNTMKDISFQNVTPGDGIAWRGDGDFDFSEKMDGRAGWLAELGVGSWELEVGKTPPFQDAKNLFRAEIMQDGRVYLLNAAVLDGQDVRGVTHRERIGEISRRFARGWFQDIKNCAGFQDIKFLMPARGNGGEFLEAVWQAGGEGVVAVPWSAKWDWIHFKCKREQNYICRVTELDHGKGSVRLALHGDGTDCGWLAMRARFDAVRIGDLLKIVAFGRHAGGKLREARLECPVSKH
jgi:hypothetical protein